VALSAKFGSRATRPASYAVGNRGGGGPPPAPTLTSINPATVTINTAYTMALYGSGFAAGMQARFWDGAGAYKGIYPTTINSPTQATVSFSTTVAWTRGTGGVDVYLNGAPSSQVHFTIT
jgi:hypothetical protein